MNSDPTDDYLGEIIALKQISHWQNGDYTMMS